MKKLILIVVIALVSNVCFGQAKISIGIKGGLNFSKFDVSNVASSGKTGFHAGAFANFRISKIGLQPEIIFSQQGSTVDFDKWESFYYNIPIIIKFFLAAGLNLQAGPQIGFLGKVDTAGVNIKNLLKSSDISIALGAGWEAPFGLTFDARYNHGLTNNSDVSGSSINNKVFQVSVGFKIFKFGK